jgi:hypothetical protein
MPEPTLGLAVVKKKKKQIDVDNMHVGRRAWAANLPSRLGASMESGTSSKSFRT